MEKLVYAFWRGEAAPDRLRERLIRELKPQIVALGAQRLQISIADFTDMSGTLINFTLESTKPRPDGIVCFWLTSAWRREPVEALLRHAFPRIAGYVVAESTILPNVNHPSCEDERTFGFSQVTLLQVPASLTFEQWRKVWFEEHTPVGIATQANFRYVQNVVVMPLTAGAPPYRAIVEEGFPIEAMRDSQVFYNAAGDEAKHQRHLAIMMQSAAKFIDFDKIDVIATSEYMLHSAREPEL
jgi:hypothetical protein